MQTNSSTFAGNRFVKGAPNLGRQKGSLNKNTRIYKKVFSETFNELQKNPKTALLSWAKKHPADFYRLAKKVIPSQIGAVLQSVNQDHSESAEG